MRILHLIKAGMMAAATVGAVTIAAITAPAAAVPAAATPGPGGWDWPLSPKPAVVRRFDPPAKPWLSGHRGVDLLGAGSMDVAVMSPDAGIVSFVGTVVDRPVITVDHGNGLRSSFEPVRSHLAKGTPVEKGQLLGAVEAGHCGAVPCLHWGVRRGEEYLNPLSFVTDLRPSVLLPLDQR